MSRGARLSVKTDRHADVAALSVEGRIFGSPAKLPAGTRVLIVEDHPFVALAVADMVVTLGGEVADTAATIEEALDAVRGSDFTIALLDIDLDGHPSTAVAIAIAAMGKPFLVTTGFCDRRVPGFEHAPLLLKPYLPSQLGRGLSELIGRHAALQGF